MQNKEGKTNTEETKNLRASALRYQAGVDDAPVVIASARGELAQKMIEIAEKHGIEVHQNSEVAQMLEKLEAGSPIPFEAYFAVAEILKYIIKQDKPNNNGDSEKQ